jgi:pimeloyl-ACP methyl ester carboxylesterase
MERMAGKIPGSRYHCLPGLNHLANLEDAAAYNAALGEFLNSQE